MDKKILQLLYETYRQEIYLYLFSLCHDREIAEDLMQETFLKAILALPDNHGNMRAWIYMVARNLYFNYAKREKRYCRWEETLHSGSSEKQELIETLIRDEQKRLLYQALDQLKNPYKEVLLMQYFGGLTQKEIAAVLHLTPENVRILAYRAKKKIREYMEVSGYDVS